MQKILVYVVLGAEDIGLCGIYCIDSASGTDFVVRIVCYIFVYLVICIVFRNRHKVLLL